MKSSDFDQHEDAGSWGTGLLLPVAKLVAVGIVIALVAHWVLGFGNAMPSVDNVAPPPSAQSDSDSPSDVAASASGEFAVHADRHGQFVVDAVLNGESVPLIVDTGASTLVLSRDDAARLGLNTQTLTYSEQYETANGVAIGAPVTLREFRVGSFSLHDVRATVLATPMPYSLLGMSVLSRFAGHEVEGNKLVLRW
jgi:clan AA aspartic protease (TIGR02281 family)